MSLTNPHTSARQVGRRIAQRRRELGLTQQELADRLRIAAAETISRYERGEREPRISTVARIAEALEMSLLEFLAGMPDARLLPGGVPVTRGGRHEGSVTESFAGAWHAPLAPMGASSASGGALDPPLLPETPVAPIPRLEDVQRVNLIASALGRMQPEQRDVILSGVEAMITSVERISSR